MKKNVLFITEPLYEYSGKIRSAVEEFFCCSIDFFEIYYSGLSNNKDKSTVLKRILNRINKDSDTMENRKIQEEFFDSHSSIRYDYILVLLQKNIHIDLLKRFLSINEKAYKILYLWDDASRVENFKDLIGMFDKVASFDNHDCQKYNLSFIPLFYLDDYIYKNEKKIYDFSFVGSLHTDRSSVLDKLLKQFPEEKYMWNAKLVGTAERIVLDKMKKGKTFSNPFYYHNKSLSSKEAAEIIKRSKVCIDIPVPGQIGLTMRTIECLAANTKMITTNCSIREYDFYNDKNIYVMDRERPDIPEEFVFTKYEILPESIIGKYSIHKWVEMLFVD